METLRLSSKGQIVLPKSLRDAHGWEAGQEFVVHDGAQGILLVPSQPFPPTSLEDVVGCAGYSGPTRSLEEMEAGIAKGARRQR